MRVWFTHTGTSSSLLLFNCSSGFVDPIRLSVFPGYKCLSRQLWRMPPHSQSIDVEGDGNDGIATFYSL